MRETCLVRPRGEENAVEEGMLTFTPAAPYQGVVIWSARTGGVSGYAECGDGGPHEIALGLTEFLCRVACR